MKLLPRISLRRFFSLLISFLSTILLVDGATIPAAPPEVVTVSAEAVTLAAVSSSVTVITTEEIEDSHAENVAELLRDTPFLHISQAGSLGALSTVTLRGGDPNFTLVLIDGVPVNDPTNLLGGSFDFSLLSTDNIERIEIVRGPLSALYGSQAMSGVINIISKRGTSSSYGADGFLGNFGSHDARAGATSHWKFLASSFSVSHFGIGEQVENDSASLGTVAFNTNFAVSIKDDLFFNFRYEDTHKSGFPENGGGPLFSILRDAKKVDAHEFIFGSEYKHQFSSTWNLKADVDAFHHVEDSNSPAVLDAVIPSLQSLPAILSHTDFDRTRLRVYSTWKFSSLSTTAGAELQKEDGTSESLIAQIFPSNFSIDRTTPSYSGEVMYGGGNWNLNAGFRSDVPEHFDSQFSPRIGFSYLFEGTGTRIRSTWGKGFKLPSFFALADPNVGNPELLPERMDSFDLGIEQQIGTPRIIASITYFYSRFHDLIDFSAEEFRVVNRSSAISRGFEAESHIDAGHGITLGAHLDFVKADLLGTSEVLRDRPKWRGGINLKWRPTPAWYVKVNWTSVGQRFDFQLPVPERNIAPGYRVVDLALDWKFARDFALYSRVDNLLDNDFQEFVGFPNPGRYLRVGLRWHVKK